MFLSIDISNIYLNMRNIIDVASIFHFFYDILPVYFMSKCPIVVFLLFTTDMRTFFCFPCIYLHWKQGKHWTLSLSEFYVWELRLSLIFARIIDTFSSENDQPEVVFWYGWAQETDVMLTIHQVSVGSLI